MKRAPFKMRTARQATLRCDGKFVACGRASFVWQTFLFRRVAGVPGVYEIRRDGNTAPWHRLDWTIEEAEEALAESSAMFGRRHVKLMQRTRANRERRGLPVG